MGYCMKQITTKFRILAQNKDAAVAAVLDLVNHPDRMSGWSMDQILSRHYSWVNMDELARAKTLNDALSTWRWEPTSNEQGDIIDLTFDGEKLGDEEVLFKALAPFVESGSYLEMQGEDSTRWRWYFKDGEMLLQYAEVSYPDP